MDRHLPSAVAVWRMLLISMLICCCLPLSAAAARVQFDVNDTIGCRDVTPNEFAASNPGERLVEAKFQVSTLLRRGGSGGPVEFLYRIESPRRTLRVFDYRPKTTLESDVVGKVSVERRREKSKSLGLSITGGYDDLVSGKATGAGGSKTTSNVRYELLPPLELISASGTTQRGSGVYFKLRPSKRASLEGAKEFVLVLRVPAAWRGDYVQVYCEAISTRRGSPEQLARFSVALYAQGDERARQAATNFIQAERELRAVVADRRRELLNIAYPTVAHRLGAALSVVGPKVPRSWLERLVRDPTQVEIGLYERHLPQEVRQAATKHVDARRAVAKLNGRVSGE